MTLRTVLRKDFGDLYRTKTVWAVSTLLVFLGGVMAYVFEGNPRLRDTLQFKLIFFELHRMMAILVPIVAIIGTYLAIAGERDRGSIVFVLTLPNTRRAVFAGKYLSRALSITLAVVAAYVTAALVLGIRMEFLPGNVTSYPLGYVVGTTVLTVIYALTFVSITIALSAGVSTRARAVVGSIGSYVALVVFYIFPLATVTDVIRWLHHDLLGLPTNQNLYQFVEYTSPLFALRKGLNIVSPTELESRPFRTDRVSEAKIKVLPSAKRYELLERIDLPVYLQDEFALVVFGFWLVVPLVVGYWRFKQADIS